jgi:hypothetical protein
MERARKTKPQPLLVLLATAFVVAAIWAATALAAGDAPSSSGESSGGQPAAELVQDDAAPSGEDCPEGQDDSGGGSGDSSGSTGSSSTDF